MERIAVTTLIAGALCFQPVAAQTSTGKAVSPKFEVVTLKPSQPQATGFAGIRPAPGGERYVAQNCPLRTMIMVAYGVKGDQINGPAWIDTDRWDMNGKAERQSTIEELHEMLKDLLVDRFKLQIRRSTKELPIYALRVDKGGTKLQPKEFANAGEPWIDVTGRAVLQMNLNAKVVT